MNTFWNNNRDRVTEDVTTSREIKRSEPASGRRRLVSAQEIAIDMIEADPQHREEFGKTALEQLARSLATEGQLQPIRVRFDEERSKYIIIAGERRWRAAKIGGLSHVACIVDSETVDKATILRHQIIENALREDLRPMEQARAYADLMTAEGWTGSQLAEHLNISQPTVSRTLALLKLPEQLQQQVDRGVVPITEAVKSVKQTGGGEGNPKAPSGKRATKERKLRTNVGITVTLKARKLLKDDQVIAALEEVLMELRAVKKVA